MKKVFVSGCYDMLHSGHVAFFEEASTYGDLYVGIGSDRTIFELKNRKTINPENERLYMVKALRCVKDAWINSGSGIMDFTKEVEALKPDIFFVNTDGFTQEKQDFCDRHGIKLVVSQRLPHGTLPVRSTTALRQECTIPYRIELGGGWQIGLVDGNPYEIGRAGSGTPWHLETWNFKEYDYFSSRSASANTPLRIFWNLPKGVAERFDIRLSYNVLWFGVEENSLVTYVNDVPVHTNSSVGWNSHVFTTDVLAESGLFRDGENEIKIDFLPCTRTESVDWATFDMISAEPARLHRLKIGTRIILR